MTGNLKLEIIAPDLDPTEVARLTEALEERLRQSDSVEVGRVETPATPGSKPVVEYLAGKLLIAVASHVAKPAIEDAKETVRTVVTGWLQGIKGSVTVRVQDGARTIAELRPQEADAPANGGKASARAGKALPAKPPLAAAASTAVAPNGAPARAGDAPEPRHYAVLIGNQTFAEDSGITPLACAANDVMAMKRSLLQFPQFYSEASIRTMIDATHYEIESAIDDVLGRAKDATVILFYSGHGKTSSVGGELYLAAANSTAKQIAVTGVEYSKIIRLINQNNARRVGIILDCCYAGMANRQSKGDVADHLNAATQQTGKGLYVIGASLETQTAMERVSDGLGVLTKLITEGLDSGYADVAEQGRVSFDNLYDYVSRTIGQYSHQVPIRSVSASGSDLIIAPSRHPKLRRRNDLGFSDELARIKDAMRSNRKAFSPAMFDKIFLSFIASAQNLGEYIRDDERYQVLLDFAYKDTDVDGVASVFAAVEASATSLPVAPEAASKSIAAAASMCATQSKPVAQAAPADRPPKSSVGFLTNIATLVSLASLVASFMFVFSSTVRQQFFIEGFGRLQIALGGTTLLMCGLLLNPGRKRRRFMIVNFYTCFLWTMVVLSALFYVSSVVHYDYLRWIYGLPVAGTLSVAVMNSQRSVQQAWLTKVLMVGLYVVAILGAGYLFLGR